MQGAKNTIIFLILNMLTLKLFNNGHSLNHNLTSTRIRLFKNLAFNQLSSLHQNNFLLTLLNLKVLTFFKLLTSILPQAFIITIHKLIIYLRFLIIKVLRLIMIINNNYLDNIVVSINKISILVETFLHNILLE